MASVSGPSNLECRLFWWPSLWGFGVAYAPSAPSAGSPKQPPFSILGKTASCFEPGKPRPPENRLNLCISNKVLVIAQDAQIYTINIFLAATGALEVVMSDLCPSIRALSVIQLWISFQTVTLASLLKSNLRVSKGNLKVDMGIQGINYTYKSSKGHAH